jgi:hypothetical protein
LRVCSKHGPSSAVPAKLDRLLGFAMRDGSTNNICEEYRAMSKTSFLPLCAGALVLIGAFATPVRAQQSQIACDAFARNYAQQASRQGKVIGGGVVGSLIGLGIGAATGGAAVGAAIGGGVGVIGGGAQRRKDAERIYRAAYNDCMAGRIR